MAQCHSHGEHLYKLKGRSFRADAEKKRTQRSVLEGKGCNWFFVELDSRETGGVKGFLLAESESKISRHEYERHCVPTALYTVIESLF